MGFPPFSTKRLPISKRPRADCRDFSNQSFIGIMLQNSCDIMGWSPPIIPIQGPRPGAFSFENIEKANLAAGLEEFPGCVDNKRLEQFSQQILLNPLKFASVRLWLDRGDGMPSQAAFGTSSSRRAPGIEIQAPLFALGL